MIYYLAEKASTRGDVFEIGWKPFSTRILHE